MAVSFYQDVLGLKLLFKKNDWAEFEIGGQRIALHKSDKPAPSSGGAVISLHAEPIEETINSLKSKGVRFVDDLKVFPYGKLASFLDPDGNLIGLYEPPIKSNNR